jgi:3-oxoacyl-[acyl-carrier protein] reductase
MSKWAIKGLTMGLADRLLKEGIVVNAIAPGPTATEMINVHDNDSIYSESNPAGRYVMPSEIASLAAFMVSDAGNMIVGDTFYMTGGSGTISYHC